MFRIVKTISFINPEAGYTEAEPGVVYKTTNGGAAWSNVLNSGLPFYWYGVWDSASPYGKTFSERFQNGFRTFSERFQIGVI